jgi:hypothetical protein
MACAARAVLSQSTGGREGVLFSSHQLSAELNRETELWGYLGIHNEKWKKNLID